MGAEKSGFADWNATTFMEGSGSNSVINAPNSSILVGTNMLIGGLLNVIVHRPGAASAELPSMRVRDASALRATRQA
ncbi:MAG: hypothetical protein WA431_06685 [Candidatus Cybelea sp.]